MARPPARLPATPARPGVLAGPGTPRDPNHTFLPPNGSPSHHLGHGDRDPTQNSGPDLAMGIPGLESQLFVHPFWTPNMPKCRFLTGFRNSDRPLAADLGSKNAQMQICIKFSNLCCTHSIGFGAPWAHGPMEAQWSLKGPQGDPRGPKGAHSPLGGDFPIPQGSAAWPKAFNSAAARYEPSQACWDTFIRK